jgi:hypothetical protein
LRERASRASPVRQAFIGRAAKAMIFKGYLPEEGRNDAELQDPR